MTSVFWKESTGATERRWLLYVQRQIMLFIFFFNKIQTFQSFLHFQNKEKTKLIENTVLAKKVIMTNFCFCQSLDFWIYTWIYMHVYVNTYITCI